MATLQKKRTKKEKVRARENTEENAAASRGIVTPRCKVGWYSEGTKGGDGVVRIG